LFGWLISGQNLVFIIPKLSPAPRVAGYQHQNVFEQAFMFARPSILVEPTENRLSPAGQFEFITNLKS